MRSRTKWTRIKYLAAILLLTFTANNHAQRHGEDHRDHKFHDDRYSRKVQITEIKGLHFGQTYTGFDQLIVTSPGDNNAAIFDITARPFTSLSVSIVQKYIIAQGSKSKKKLRIGRFTTGGGVDEQGRGVTDSRGQLSNVRIGGTAVIKSRLPQDTYVGSATLRVVTQ